MKGIFVKFLFIVLLTFAPFASFSQAKIKVKVENHIDSIYYLIKYTSDKTHSVIDTSSLSSGYKVFYNKTNYDEGIYVLADSKQNPLFEILMGKDQKFSIHVEDLMDLKSYEVKGCKETSAYFDIYAKTTYNKLHIKALESELKYYPDNARKIDSIKSEHNEYLESIKVMNQDSFLNTYIDFNKEIIVPQEYKDNSEQYIIDHYFDNIRFCDARILNTRLLKNKLDYYFGNYMSKQTPNIICQKINYLLGRTVGNNRRDIFPVQEEKVRDYVLWYLYSKYFNPDNIENELVYIQLVDNYFSRLEIENLTENIRKEIIKRVDILRNITIGKIAPTFSFTDDNGNTICLDNINSKYTVLFFYKPDCLKCIRDKRILGLVKKRINDLEILHINISEDKNNISRDVVNQYDIMTTPTIYLLNENKEIIAKHIKAEEIEFHIIKR